MHSNAKNNYNFIHNTLILFWCLSIFMSIQLSALPLKTANRTSSTWKRNKFQEHYKQLSLIWQLEITFLLPPKTTPHKMTHQSPLKNFLQLPVIEPDWNNQNKECSAFLIFHGSNHIISLFFTHNFEGSRSFLKNPNQVLQSKQAPSA